MGASGALGPFLKEVGEGTSWVVSTDGAFDVAVVVAAPGEGADENVGRVG